MEYKSKNIIKIAGRLAVMTMVAASVSACDENAWNDEHLDGFEEPSITVKKQVSDTLTSAQVKTLANMKANIALAESKGQLEELKAVAASGVFNSVITPEEYAPAYLDSIAGSTKSKIYYLEKNSTLKLYYPTTDGMPDELALIPGAQRYTVNEDNYKDVWGGEDWTDAFTPSKEPSKFIPSFLEAELDPENPYAVVTYNYSQQEPNFGGGSQPEEPKFELSNVAGSIKSDKGTYTVNGIVTAICQQGYIITDNSGSVLVYYGKTFDPAAGYACGQQRVVTGTGGSYGGALQLAPTDDQLKGEDKSYKYPVATKVDGAKFDALLNDFTTAKEASTGLNAMYVEVDANEITISGNYVNFTVTGAASASGSVYQSTAAQREIFNGITSAKITGFAVSTSTSGDKKFVNIIPVTINGKAPVYSAPLMRGQAVVTSKVMSQVYHYAEGAWSLVPNTIVLNPSDYAEMGYTSNLTDAQAQALLPIFLTRNYPYATKGTQKYVVYNRYANSETQRNFCCAATYDGSQWLISTVYLAEMQFVCSQEKGSKNLKWIYDPSIYIDLPYGKGAASQAFWQKCVDWVWENYDKPFFNSTSITDGLGYVTTFGNNEYFAGTSAYQCNVDIRASAAKKQTPSIYGQMNDEQIQALVKSNFETVLMPAILAQEYPDAMPGVKADQYYVITFGVYDGATTTHTIRYLVTAPGTFQFVECTWNKK